jgi:hypothetical protein
MAFKEIDQFLLTISGAFTGVDVMITTFAISANFRQKTAFFFEANAMIIFLREWQ